MIALHARSGDAATGLAHARRAFGDGPDIVALQAARPCNPLQSNLRTVPHYAGFTWYLGDHPSRPEAASFGDALAQLDAFVRDLTAPFVLAGQEQGAVLAVTLALHAPRGLAGVYACGGAIPAIDGWQLPRTDLEQLEFVFTQLDPAMYRETALTLEERGVTVRDGDALDAGAMTGWLQSRLVAHQVASRA